MIHRKTQFLKWDFHKSVLIDVNSKNDFTYFISYNAFKSPYIFTQILSTLGSGNTIYTSQIT